MSTPPASAKRDQLACVPRHMWKAAFTTILLVLGLHTASGAFVYEKLAPATSADDLVKQANAEGAKGYRYVGAYAAGGTIFGLYMKDTSVSTTYLYETLPSAANRTKFIEQANAEGAKSYRFMNDFVAGSLVSNSLYEKDSTGERKITYETQSPPTNADSFITTANAQGAKNLRYMGDYAFGADGISSVYEKDSGKTATYTYHLLPGKTDLPGSIEQATAEGALSFRFKADVMIGGSSPAYSMYVKDSSQLLTFSYETLTPAAGATEFLDQVNAQGKKGYSYLGDGAYTPGFQIRSVYVKAGSGAADVVPSIGITSDSSVMANISTRGAVGVGDNVMIAGFVVSGSAPKTVLIRASGPVLSKLGVANALADPLIELFNGNSVKIGSNNNWSDSQEAEITSTAARLGAYAWDSGSKDAAMIVTLQPGSYSAVVKGANNTTGNALIEVYDAGGASRLVNISTRGGVGTGDTVMIAGFVIGGSKPKSVLLRASGPTLGKLGVVGSLAEPIIEAYRGSTLIGANRGWANDQLNSIKIVGSAVGAYSWTEDTKDAAILLTLDPGAYSAIVKGANNSTGNALVEVYEVN